MAAGTAAVGSVATPARARRPILRVGLPGGVMGDGLVDVLRPMAGALGVDFAAVPAGSSVADVALVGRRWLAGAAATGVVAPLPARVAEAAAVDPCFRVEGPHGPVGLGAMAWIMGLAVDAGRTALPDTWRALWQEGAAGALALPRGLDDALPDLAAKLVFGGTAALATPDGVAAAVAHVAQLAPRVGLWWRDPGDAERALAEGRVTMAMLRHVPPVAEAASGSLRTVVPSEGGPMVCAYWCRPTRGAMPDAAEAFIEAATDLATQGAMARVLGVMPVVDFAAAGLSIEEFIDRAIARPIRPAFETGVRPDDPLTVAWRAMLPGAPIAA